MGNSVDKKIFEKMTHPPAALRRNSRPPHVLSEKWTGVCWTVGAIWIAQTRGCRREQDANLAYFTITASRRGKECGRVLPTLTPRRGVDAVPLPPCARYGAGALVGKVAGYLHA